MLEYPLWSNIQICPTGKDNHLTAALSELREIRANRINK